jgi:UDP-N-acetylmuramoyl-L-alanyl-D-glutamate--2,6-diaminopimelate ligase
MHLRDLLADIRNVEWRGERDLRIRGLAYDSRMVRSGYLFVALKGLHADGASYIPQALERGAVAVASEDSRQPLRGTASLTVPDGRRFLAEAARGFYRDPASKLRLVAITGTNGKTTTSYIADSVLRAAGLRTCVVGTIGRKIGDRPFPTEHTTPEASDLMSFLREAVRAGCTHGSLEVSSHALALKRVYGTKFSVGLFTNLTQDHLDFHGDMESYFEAKRLLFTPAGGNEIEAAVINIDDPYGRRLASGTACPILTFGSKPEADVQFLGSTMWTDGSEIRLATPAGEKVIRTCLVGRPNAYNIMAATAAAFALGIDADIIVRGIEAAPTVPGRLEPVAAGQPYPVFVDYAHTPDALENLLLTVSGLPHRRIILVFGCGGDRDRTKRPIMGEIAARLSTHVIATSDNPRTEDPLAILEQIEAGLRSGPASCEVVPDRRAAIGRAVAMAHEDDVVVIAGKGHEDYQIVGARTFAFDDRTVAREMILQMSNVEGAKSPRELHQ